MTRAPLAKAIQGLNIWVGKQRPYCSTGNLVQTRLLAGVGEGMDAVATLDLHVVLVFRVFYDER